MGKDADAYKVDGQTINTCDYGYNNFLNTYRKTLDILGLVPMHTVGVFDAPHARERREKVYDNYKYYNYQMKITEQTSKVRVRGWFNYMGWSFGGGSEFHNYLNSIFNDPRNYLNLNNFLIRYTT